MTKDINQLIEKLMQDKVTMVLPHAYSMVLKHQDNIKKVQGEIVECGVWRGGFSIFMAHLFSDRTIWVCDSFEGFQPLEQARYSYNGERHTPSYVDTHLGPIGISLEEVKSHFETYGLGEDKRIKYLKGFVKDTLNPETCEIGEIALLRIDVDAYSATLEVLESLYSKVKPGGYIIFDDSCLHETLNAIRTFCKTNNLPYEIIDPITDQIQSLDTPYTTTDSGFTAGCYIIKK